MSRPVSVRAARRGTRWRPAPPSAAGAALAALALVALGAKAWHPLRSVAYAVTGPSEVELRDFGRSDVLHADGVAWRWEPVRCEVAWTRTPARDASLAGAPFPVFRPPLRRAMVTLALDDCDHDTVLLKLRDAAGRSFRFVVRPSRSGSRCHDEDVFANASEDVELECAVLRGTPEADPPAPPRPTSSPAPALWSTIRYDAIAPSLGPLMASRSLGLSVDFRFANYNVFSRAMGRVLIDKVEQSDQSLLLLSSEMLRGTISQDVWLDAFAASLEFPYYIVLRSPLAYRDVGDRTVMHLKGFAIDDAYAQYATSIASGGPGRFEIAVEAFDPASIAQVRALVAAPLLGDPGHRLGAASPMGRLYYNAPERGSDPSDALDDPPTHTPFEAALERELAGEARTLVVLLARDQSTWIWRALAASPATRVLVVVNVPTEGDLTPKRLLEARALLERGHPDRLVRIIGVADPTPPSHDSVHARAFLFDDERCVLSESSFSPVGTRRSDDAFLAATPPICRAMRAQVRALFQLSVTERVPPELTTSDTLSFGRAAGVQTDPPQYEFYDVTNAGNVPRPLDHDDLARAVAPFLE